MDELRVLLAPLDAEKFAIESEIAALGDQGDRLRELDMLPALVDEYLRDLAYLVEGSGLSMREYETVPAKRTQENPLGAYTLTPEAIRDRTEEELAEKRLEVRNARSARFRDLYQSLGLAVVVHKDGTLEFSSSLGAPERVLPSVTPASMGVSG